jgi:hypothetical protein
MDKMCDENSEGLKRRYCKNKEEGESVIGMKNKRG